MRSNRLLVYSVFLLALSLVLLILAVITPFGYLELDSNEYMQLAEAIYSGRIFVPLDPYTAPLGEMIRAPGYPAVIALSFLLPCSPEHALLILHGILFLIAAFVLVRALENKISILILFLSLALLAVQDAEFFAASSSEWTALCLLIIFLAMTVRLSLIPRAKDLFFVSLSASLVVLTRPALITVLLFPWIYLFINKVTYKERFRLCLALLLGFSPILLWMSLNKFRLGQFSIAATDGYALTIVGTLIDSPSIKPEDPAQLKAFIQLMNNKKAIPSAEQLDAVREINPKALGPVLSQNFDAFFSTIKELNLNWIEANNLMKTYALRAIKEHFSAYVLHVMRGAQTLLLSVPFMLPCLILPLLFLRDRKYQSLAFGAVTIFVVHFTHVLTIITSQVMGARYYSITFYLVTMFSLLCSYVWVRDAFFKKSSLFGESGK